MENEKEQHICRTCKYFTQHYRKLSDGTFRTTACGFCSKDLAHMTKRRQPPFAAPCRYWEPVKELTPEQVQQEITERLKDALSGVERAMLKLDHLVDEDIF